MSQDILAPFFDLFYAWKPEETVARFFSQTQVSQMTVHQDRRALEAVLHCTVQPDEALLTRVERELAAIYQMEEVSFEVCICAQDEPDAAQDESDAAQDEPDRAEGGPTAQRLPGEDEAFARTRALREEQLGQLKKKAPARKKQAAEGKDAVIMGKRPLKRKTVTIGELHLDLDTVTVEGDVFDLDHRELKKRGAWVISFDMTDYTGSVRVTKFLLGDEGKDLAGKIAKGQRLLVQGRLNLNRYDGEMVLEPTAITVGTREERRDDAPEKRVELHLHTKMSAMDATTDVRAAVARAARWGHSAIAVTDHGVVHSFPDLWSAAKGKLKPLYGVEAYFNNDVDDRVAVQGEADGPLGGPVVCFDIETTGLDARRDAITEIGAVVLENGALTDTFSTFVQPGRPLSAQITALTGITDAMLAGAPSQEEALRAFLAFAGGRPLAAHNAEFDMGFLAAGCARYEIPFDLTSVDTLVLAQNLLPELSKHKLDLVARHLNIPAFSHHRAGDDAGAVAHILTHFFPKLEELGVSTLQEINPAMTRLRGKGTARRHPRHLIVLAKNKTGLRNLYKLISLSHLEHFRRFPIMPKSAINANREGLILGSACEAGELYQAVVRGKDWRELKRIAAWYDFLEIQPVSNNAFMLRPDRNGRSAAANEEEIRNWNRTIVRLGEELGRPVCATGDVHFIDPEDEVFRHVLLSAKEYPDADAPNPLYLRTTDEMLAEFSYLGAEKAFEVVVTNTNLVAGWCEDMKPLPDGLFTPKLENSAQELQDLVWSKAKELYGNELPPLIEKRVKTELGDIIDCKYDVIYMSAQKLVQDSLAHGYLVGSRGSVGSSVVAYLSGITEVNALPPHYRCPQCCHSDFDAGEGFGCGADMPDEQCPICGTPYAKEGFHIPFETFLGFGGDKVPDIDLNFSGEYQASAHKYTFALFGEKHVFRAGTIGKVAEKTAFGYMKKYLEHTGRQATKAEENRLVQGCVGVKRTTGQHPGGMVVIPQDMEIYDFCPVQHPADDADTGIITTHFEYHSMEENLLKLDLLGHDDPSMVRMLEDLTGVSAREIPLDDKETMSLFTSSEALGFTDDKVLGPTGAVAIPEFGTSFVRGMLTDTEPDQFDTLVRLSGFSHGTDVWLGNARDLILSGTAGVNQAIGCRDDIMIYLISRGIDEVFAFQIMESVRKGKGLPKGAEEEMKQHGVPDWYIGSCRKIAYLFPKAHAVAYVMMAFRIAWFKVHRPLAFYAAYFSIRAKAFNEAYMCRGMEVVQAKMREILAKEKSATAVELDMLTTLEVCYEFYLRGFTFRRLDLYRSDALRFLMDEENGTLTPPFVSVGSLGETAARAIVEQRTGKTFVSIEEFAAACPKVSQTHIELLKEAGALGDLPDTSQLSLF